MAENQAPDTAPDSETGSDPEPGSEPPAPRRSTVRSLLRLWPYVRPIRARLAVSVTAAMLASLSALLVPTVLGRIVDGPIAERDLDGLWAPAALLLLLGLAEAALFWTRRVVLARPLSGVETAMRGDLFAKLQRLPVSFHDRWGSGQLLSRATSDMYTMRLFLAFPLVFLIVNTVTFLVGTALMFTQDWRLALIVLGPAVPLLVLTRRFEAGYSGAARRAQDQNGDLATVVEESVLGIRILKAFGRHRSMAERFREHSRQLRRTELRKAGLLANLWSVIVGLPELALGCALAVGVHLVAQDQLSAGTLVAFLSTALSLRWPVESLGWLLAYANEAATATDRYFEVLDEPEAEAAEAPAGSTAGSTDTQDGIRLTGVRFRYPDAPADTPDLLRGVDLHIRSGETMALVGATGSGKTTLTALLPRLYEATGGSITLDGRDIREFDRTRLRELVAVAFEEPTLFSATVRENVLMGAPGADEERLHTALATAQAGFVEKLPEGVATEVGEQGLSLSGGQRQRLALARAVVGDPAFLVLDDPLSALDVHTEALVERALRQVLAATTALVVAHRPSTVLLADRVAVLAEGRIEAVGTHQELLRDSARYRELMSGEAALVPEGSTAR
ncbi:ABC transporter ATP-binding protein [Kitasatospora purpeofusca]|uniref:ABC transporter ATP-binding protein n=1 Tax=Kitasatospora purpeofusca TaxID=67352 RepID=UPI0022544BDB|nr:ABC transporter ATP-binding protein [Kitasatospora purpeofusca]MCX4754966.1 ABC transporter ATP-binding protein/permease [Kitasatospora purpeofusca]WSR34346.1 ABC transporter ATP-binding protein/permease [Kitasatospora purpeofusca]WSR42570.1 ABC transporter ATP-binding protein/permease [Kitasatospora purpeofusca]